ncbi:MAG: hypothetical protein JWL69_4304 [Phycisphaerales bacterium]|nr:hypothetical protein [Phycisphaerales bacterium]
MPKAESGYIGPDRVFVSKDSVARQITFAVVIGLALLGASILLMVLGAREPAKPDHRFEPGLNSGFVAMIGCSVMGGFSLLRAIFLLRMPRRVVLNALGLQIDGIISRRRLRWAEIGSVTRETRSVPFASESVQLLEIVDVVGRRRAVVADTLQDFDALADELIKQSSAIVGQSTYVPERREAQIAARDSRRIRRTAWIFLFFVLAMAGGLIAGINEELHTRRYATEGLRVDARIVRTWMVHVTPHVEYSFKDSAGRTFSRDVMMFQGPDWDAAHLSKTVPVIYLRSAPDWNRLVNGEDPGAQFGGSFLWLCSGGLLMFTTLFIISVLGYDLRIKDGTTSLMRYGRVIKQWDR